MDAKNCGTDLDHSVTMVGFSDEESTPYWVIKNSWGTGWGWNGFMKLEK
jgi:C1A family cysteine protease